MAFPISGFVSASLRWLALLGMAVWLSGCAGGGSSGAGSNAAAPRAVSTDKLRKGDLVSISFSGIATPPAEQEERIKEDGTINLQLLGPVTAEGKTPGELQKEIQDGYVPKYFRRLTVTVKTENRFFYVDGEVRSGGRLMYAGELTALRAIASAGGFTDFAARTRVQLIRATGEKIRIDAKKAAEDPRHDPMVLPGDTIIVPRRSPFGK